MPAESETEPCVEAVELTAVTVSVWPDSLAGPRESFVVNVEAAKVSTPSSATDLESATAVGASFTSVIVRLKVATLLSTVPSFALNVKLSVPLKFAFGVYVRLALLPLRTPLVGPETIVYASGLPSASVQFRLAATAVSSGVVALPFVQTGAAFAFLKCAKASVRLPLLPPLSFEMQGVGVPGTSTPESVFLAEPVVPTALVHLSNVLVVVVVVTDLRRTESVLPPKPVIFTVPLAVGMVTVRFVFVGVPLHVLLGLELVPFQRS